jgi:hypothetical protein
LKIPERLTVDHEERARFQPAFSSLSSHGFLASNLALYIYSYPVTQSFSYQFLSVDISATFTQNYSARFGNKSSYTKRVLLFEVSDSLSVRGFLKILPLLRYVPLSKYSTKLIQPFACFVVNSIFQKTIHPF